MEKQQAAEDCVKLVEVQKQLYNAGTSMTFEDSSHCHLVLDPVLEELDGGVPHLEAHR